MAAYAATITLDTPRAMRVGNGPLGVLIGTCNLSNYNQTLAEITTITKKFKAGGFLRVIADGISSNGHVVKWDTSGKAFKAFRGPTITVGAPTITTGTDAGTTEPMYTNGGALTQTTGAAGITGVQAPAVSAGSAAALAQTSSDVDVGTFNFVVFGQMG